MNLEIKGSTAKTSLPNFPQSLLAISIEISVKSLIASPISEIHYSLI